MAALDYTSVPRSDTKPHEITLQSLSKQLLKSGPFRGFYIQRRYVANVQDCRDIVCLQKCENSLDKLLRDIRDKLQLLYCHQDTQFWIGITSGTLRGIPISESEILDTYLWVEMKDLVFGEYLFSVKSIDFRDNEIILKLEGEEITRTSNNTFGNTNNSPGTTVSSLAAPRTPIQAKFYAFGLVLLQWWALIEQRVHHFMQDTITVENLEDFVDILKSFFKHLGPFTLQFMTELIHLIQALTPFVLKILDVFLKIITGIFTLLALYMDRNQSRSIYYEHSNYMNSVKNKKRRRPKRSVVVPLPL